jgi:cobalt-zinc-cadmium efflux system protein
MPVDPLLSLGVAVLILRSAWILLRKSGHILLEGAPEWLDEAELREALVAAVPAVRDVHHVHAWMLTMERPLITLHARVTPGVDPQVTLAAIQKALAERFGIEHATVQIETSQDCT